MSSERVVTLKIDGDLAKGGRVPLDILAEKLKALQDMVLAAAQVVRPVLAKGSGRHKETAQRKVTAKDACQLVFRDFRKNCLTLEAELPETDALFPEYVDWGLQSVDRAGAVLWAIQAKDERRLVDLVPESSRRLNLLKKAEHLMPRASNYSISLTTANQFVDFQTQADAYIHGLEARIAAERQSDIRTIIGEVFRSDSDAGTFGQIGLKIRGHHVVCDLTSDTKTQIREYSPGVFAEVTGKALLTKTGKIQRITETHHLRALGMEPLPWTRIIFGEQDFQLHRPLIVDVHFDEEGWTYESKELGIMGYGRQRREAAQTFQQDFAACWDNIAQAPDSILAHDALGLKAEMLALVRRVGRAE